MHLTPRYCAVSAEGMVFRLISWGAGDPHSLAIKTQMKSEILQLLEKKVSETVRGVDEKTATDVRNLWNTVNPSPACPAVGGVMKQINQICHHGLAERGEKALEVTVSTLREFRKFIDEILSNEVIKVMERHFPENQYVELAKNTKGVYEHRQAPPNKFSERAYELEVAAISAGSANLSRRAVANIRTAVNELKLQKTAGLPTRWERVKKVFIHQLAAPVIRWVFVIIAAVIAAIVVYLLGING